MRLILVPGEEPTPPPMTYATTITPDDLTEMVRVTIETNRSLVRPYPLQTSIDRVIEEAYDNGEIELAATLLQVVAARSAGLMHTALQTLLQTMIDLMPSIRQNQQCRVRHCTNDVACVGGCSWVEVDLCSRCVENTP